MGVTRVQVIKNKAVLAEKCEIADSYWVRLKGLMGKERLAPGEGMLFPRCNSVHMWFMKISLDVIFVDRKSRVTTLRPHARAWRILPLVDWRADSVIELPAGTIDRYDVREGDELCIG